MILELALLGVAAVLARRASAPHEQTPADGSPRQAVRAALPVSAGSAWGTLAAQLRDLQRFYSGVVGKPLRVTHQIAARVAYAGPLAVADELIAPGLVPPRRPAYIQPEPRPPALLESHGVVVVHTCRRGHKVDAGAAWCPTCDRGVSGCDKSCRTTPDGIIAHGDTCER